MKQLFILLLLAISSAATAETLVSYNFDDQNIATGADTFRAFEHANTNLRLSAEFPHSGRYSVELSDSSDNRDFPELQAYFAQQDAGTIHFNFAFLVANPQEPLNIALAGPAHFSMKKHGIGFWLLSQAGELFHISDSIAKKLITLQAYTWYQVQTAYHIDSGTYDLRIMQEGNEQAIIDLKNQSNASNTKHSIINTFSFISDLEDHSNVTYYVDDVSIKLDTLADTTIAAAGHRHLFIDAWRKVIKHKPNTLQCMPANVYTDFGISAFDLARLEHNGTLKLISRLMNADDNEITPDLINTLNEYPHAHAVAHWRLGCKNLLLNNTNEALTSFNHAEAITPDAPIYKLSRAITYLKKQDFVRADTLISKIYPQWVNDERFSNMQAMAGMTNSDFFSTEHSLSAALNVSFEQHRNTTIDMLWGRSLDQELLTELQLQHPNQWQSHLRSRLLVEQYYFSLLWKNRLKEAKAFAQQVEQLLLEKEAPNSLWLEFQGNAELLMGNYDATVALYQQAIAHNIWHTRHSTSVLLKLSDLYHLLGDITKEQENREHIYNSLHVPY